MSASGTSQRSIGLGSLFDSIFSETNKVSKEKNFILLLFLLLPLVFTFSIDHFSPHTTLCILLSHRQRCVTVFEMRSIRRKSPIPLEKRTTVSPLKDTKKNRLYLVLYQIFICKYLHLHYADVVISSRIPFEFISNFTLIPQVENRCTQFKSDVSGAISFSGRKYTARINAFNNSLD